FVVDPDLERILQTGKAGIFLAAHFGSFEAARVIGPQLGGISLRIVLDKAVNGRFIDIMTRINPELENLIIDSEQPGVELGLEISDTLKAGQWAGFLADRHRASDRTTSQNFLGSPTLFPVGPYIIASVFKAPVIMVFCRLTPTGYEVHMETLAFAVDVPRKQRQQAIDALAADYVGRLEAHVRASPYGWFNFYDFWEN
ncbi:MAG: hypothetical protein O3A63_17405, partial [Proteobacteria bacterium]|nr:hypothetical protein [Pseudomonadota bacterium]